MARLPNNTSRDPFEPYPGMGAVQSDLTEYEHDLGGQVKDVLAEPEESRPLPSFVLLLILVVGLLGYRLFDLQILEGARNRVLAEGNRIRSREIIAPRGEIRDRHGTLIAANVAAYHLAIYPAELPRKRDERLAVLQTLGEVTGLDTKPLIDQIDRQGLYGIGATVLADHIDRDTALVWQIKLADLPGISITKVPQRSYAPIGDLGHILGYTGQLSEKDHERWPKLSLTAQVGKSGLELEYEEDLQGVPGEERIEVDAKGRVERILTEIPPQTGGSLTLTIDAIWQQSLFNHLVAFADRRGSTKAAAVVTDVKTGAVRALVSLPGYDPTVFVDSHHQAERQRLLEDPNQPLLNRVTSGSYPSGSTLKPVIATAALAEGIVTPATTLDTSAGVIQIGEFRFPDWKVHGLADIRTALAESNDIFFYALGGGHEHISGLGPDKMRDWLHKFGFGTPTGIDLPSEADGLVPDNRWKLERLGERWYIGDSYHLAIGQGYFLATPLQINVATATIAGNGDVLVPYLLQERRPATDDAIQTHAPSVARAGVASPAILEVVREGMRQTVTSGTARSLGEIPVSIAGKTGTAQFGKDNLTHSWFTGYAPADNPEIAITVLVEGGGESSDAAVPAAKAFLLDWAKTRSQP